MGVHMTRHRKDILKLANVTPTAATCGNINTICKHNVHSYATVVVIYNDNNSTSLLPVNYFCFIMFYMINSL